MPGGELYAGGEIPPVAREQGSLGKRGWGGALRACDRHPGNAAAWEDAIVEVGLPVREGTFSACGRDGWEYVRGFCHGGGEGKGIGHVPPLGGEQTDLRWRGLRGGVVQQLSKLSCLREVPMFAKVREVREECPVREEDEEGPGSWELRDVGEALKEGFPQGVSHIVSACETRVDRSHICTMK